MNTTSTSNTAMNRAFLVIFLLMLLISAGAYYWYNRDTTPTFTPRTPSAVEEVVPVADPVPPPEPEPQPQPDPTPVPPEFQNGNVPLIPPTAEISVP